MRGELPGGRYAWNLLFVVSGVRFAVFLAGLDGFQVAPGGFEPPADLFGHGDIHPALEFRQGFFRM